MYLLESLDGVALNEVIVWLLNAPVDLAVQLALLWDAKVVLLAIKVIKQGVQTSCDVPPTLQRSSMMGWVPILGSLSHPAMQASDTGGVRHRGVRHRS